MSQYNKAIGKVFKVMPILSGNSKEGRTWQKKGFVIESQEKYKVQIYFSLWNNDIRKYDIKVGENVEVSFDISSRENGGKYYTELKAWNIRKLDTINTISIPSKPLPYPGTTQVPKPEPLKNIGNEIFDDLPF